MLLVSKRPAFTGLWGKTPEAAFGRLATPCYILDKAALRRNGEILKGVQDRTGCRILLAQKAFSNYDLYPVLEPYLAGTEASGLYEAKLGREAMPGKEVHVFCGAYRADQMEEVCQVADHIVFNSPRQLETYGPMAKKAGKSVGLRINPECSTQEGHAIYDPCAPGSRMGTTRAQWDAWMTPDLVDLLDGIHFHTLCEQGFDALERTLDAVEARFGTQLAQCQWINFGGGHHITREGYDLDRLCRCITRMQQNYGAQIYLEPGEAVALDAGWLVATVLDVVQADMPIAILDTSASCHMPDVLEMPYRPNLLAPEDGELRLAGENGEKAWTCRLAGKSCLAGDVIGEYSFAAPLKAGDRLIFTDMAIYSMVKTTTFNGLRLPSIGSLAADPAATARFRLVRRFGYEDFKTRLS